jgi:hypothetical protein
MVLVTGFSIWAAAVVGPLVALGLPYLLAQTGRDRGRRKEAELYELWGGKPSTVKLRYRDAALNAHTKARYHANGQALMPGVKFPTAAEEAADPAAADSVYEAFGDVLRERTRETKKFSLIFEELMNYGFRRNLWGWKAVGTVLSGAVLVLLFGMLIWSTLRTSHLPSLMGALLVDSLILFFWLFWASPGWVKIAGDAYADRLLEASDQLARGGNKEGTKADRSKRGKRSGRSCQGTPVRKIQRTPFSTPRLICQGRPRPSARRLGRDNGSSTAHWASVRSMYWIYSILHNSRAPNRLHAFMR